jgi:hypothetical protein
VASVRSVRIRKKQYRVVLVDGQEQFDNQETGKPDVDGDGNPVLTDVVKAVEMETLDETPGPEVTVFKLSAIPLKMALKVGKLSRQGEPEGALYEVLKEALTGWEHMTDEEGDEVSFSLEHVDLMDMDEAVALASFVVDKSVSRSMKKRRRTGNA